MIIIADAQADIGRYVVVHNMLQRSPGETVVYLAQPNWAHVESLDGRSGAFISGLFEGTAQRIAGARG